MARMNVLAEVAKGLKANVFTIDNCSPVSRVAVYVRAGSRYEPDEHPGISHYVKASALLSNQDSSGFGIVRYTEQNGSCLKVSLQREHIVYQLDSLRNKLGNVLGFIDSILHKPEFRSWELVDETKPRLMKDIELLKKNQEFVTNEALHKVAYRGGLAHATIVPEHMIDKIKQRDLLDYVKKNFVLSRMAFVGLGIEEDRLRDMIEGNFSLNNDEYHGVSGASRYAGGELRIQANFPHTMVKLVVEGCPISDLRGQAALEIIGTILGDSQKSYIKYGAGPPKSVNNLLCQMSPDFKSKVINIGYSDTGLFGITMVGPNDKLKDGVKKAYDHMKKTISKLSDADVKSAAATLKARSLISGEDNDLFFSNLGLRHANNISGKSPLELLDKITKKDVQEVGAKLLKTKPTLVSTGNPRFVPYVDELDS